MRGAHLRLTFPSGNLNGEWRAFEPAATTISYFLGHDPTGWRPDVPVWAAVRYPDLYPGLDLVWDRAGSNLRLLCHAADCAAVLAQVQLRVEGAAALTLADGELHITTVVGDFDLPLFAVQGAAGRPLPPLTATPRLRGDVVSAPFAAITDHTPAASADDPSDLLFSTFLGGSEVDFAWGLALDAAGNVMVAGRTYSDDFPTTPGAFDAEISGSSDAFVARLNPDGNQLLYSTFLGGGEPDLAADLALDTAGSATITGFTRSADFPTTPGAFDTDHNGANDVFVTRLNADGSELLYSTFLGAVLDEYGGNLVIDEAGNATVIGETDSGNFPTTPGAFDQSHGGEFSDVFVTRLNPDGSDLIYSTFLGGFNIEYGDSVAVDGAGNATVGGSTFSADFPTTPGAFQTVRGGWVDAFVARLNAAGSDLLFSTYLGGTGWDYGEALVLDAGGNVIITGSADSPDFPITPGAFDNSFSGGDDDAFVTHLNAAGDALLYSTFLGGSDSDRGLGLAVDAAGNAVVTGSTASADFPTTPGAYDTTFAGGNEEVFITRLNTSGSTLLYSTFLGRGKDDIGYNLALASDGNAIVTGETASPYFPTTPGVYDMSFNGGVSDAFVSKLRLEGPTDVVLSGFGGGSSVAGGPLWLILLVVGIAAAVLRIAGAVPWLDDHRLEHSLFRRVAGWRRRAGRSDGS
jgi:hypothetical protein